MLVAELEAGVEHGMTVVYVVVSVRVTGDV